MKSLSFRLFSWGALGLALGGTPALHANQAVILGLDESSEGHFLSSRVCAHPGQTLRLGGDVLDYQNRRMLRPREEFVWRMTTPDGRWQQWDPRWNAGQGPFERGREWDSVYVTFPRQGLSSVRVDVWSHVFSSARPASLWLVDPDQSTQCRWAPADVYLDTGEPTLPPPTDPQVCGERCQVGDKCLDACPPGARCVHVPAEPPFWRVLSCGQ